MFFLFSNGDVRSPRLLVYSDSDGVKANRSLLENKKVLHHLKSFQVLTNLVT